MQQKYVISISIILAASIIGFFIYLAAKYNNPKSQSNWPVAVSQNKFSIAQIPKCQSDDNTIVTKVIDGDTVVVLGGEHVRLLGIDADEKNYPCYKMAKNRLEALVQNKQVKLERDVADVDQYGRCLRTVFVGAQNINLELVKEGLAVARFYAPNTRYKDEISFAEQSAMQNKIGCKWNNVN